MASAPTPQSPAEFTAAQQDKIREFARAMQRTGAAIVALGALLAGAVLAGGVLAALGFFSRFPLGLWGCLLFVLLGALTAFVGVALATGSTDARYIVETKGYEKDHLANALISVSAAYTALTIFGGLLCAVLLFRLFT